MSTDNCKTLVTRRVTWNPDETKILISLVGEYSTQNGKLTNAETYQQVSEQMQRLGHKKTPDQCKIKWKHLKNFYYEARKKKTDQERYTICPFYKEIRNAVGSQIPTPSKKSTATPVVAKLTKSKCRSDKTDKCFPKTTYEFQQYHKFAEPETAAEWHSSNKKSPIRGSLQISSSVTVSPCSPSDADDQPLELTSSKSKSNKCHSSVDTEKGDTFPQNGHDGLPFAYSSAISPTPKPPVAQTYENDDENWRENACSSPTHLFNSMRMNRFAYSPEVCIKWNSYQINMQNTLPVLLDGDKFVDVTLACEGKFLKCHKLILSACSIYFDELLSQATSQYPIIFMKDMKFWQIQAIIEFMYRGEVNIAQERLSSLLAAAEALRVKGLAAPSNSASNPIDSPKLYSTAKRNRKRKYHLTNDTSDLKSNVDYPEALDMSTMNKDQHHATVNNQSKDEDSHYSNGHHCTLADKDTEIKSPSCVTTIILPDHNYQQNTSCKLSEYVNHDQGENNFQINNQEKRNDDETTMQNKNHHDHMYSKPQKIKNQQFNQTELNSREEDVHIHDNTIFYSYLQIDDSNSGKT